jgi:hypothetical protein
LNDEGVNGSVHLRIGTSANLVGSVSARTHFNAIPREPSIWIAEAIVLGEGQVLFDEDAAAPQ